MFLSALVSDETDNIVNRQRNLLAISSPKFHSLSEVFLVVLLSSPELMIDGSCATLTASSLVECDGYLIVAD